MRQVVNEFDLKIAMLDWIAVQLAEKFRPKYPDKSDAIDILLYQLTSPEVRESSEMAQLCMMRHVHSVTMAYTECMLDGCPVNDNHEFEQGVLDLYWNARFDTIEWLGREGIVTGQSVN